jgi:hypothetical protein
MPKRERYDELSILAAIGDTSAEDLSDLREHLDGCVDCQEDYGEFAEVVFPQLTLPQNLASQNSRAGSDSNTEEQSVRSRFLKRAQADGIAFSPRALNPALLRLIEPERPEHSNAVARWGARAAIAASLILAAGAGGYGIARIRDDLNLTNSARPALGGLQTARGTHGVGRPTAIQDKFGAQASPPTSSDEARRIGELERQLRSSVLDLAADRANVTDLELNGAALQDQIDRQQQELASAEGRAQAAEQAAADLKTQLDSAQSRASSNEAALLLDEVKLKDLSDQLTQAQETLTATHEVGSLMAERNLHIVDVYDTDAQGKTKSIFGRIFLTGNKRLLFYAYDLNAPRLENAKYTYRVWGEKLGPGQSAKALGAFYSDDATQRRWVFEYDDAKVLAEIDSVFVTFEPTAKASDRPRGPKLMYAYLRGDANHP